MNREKLAAELLATFVEELEIHVASLNRDLLALEEAVASGKDEDELLHSLFRTTHTVKGSSRAAGAILIEQASHRIEDVLALLREKKLPLSPALFELLFGVTDAIADAGERLRRSEGLDAAPLEKLVTRLAEVTGSLATEGALPPPSASPPVPSAGGPLSGGSGGQGVRIGTEKLDDLVAGIGELSVLQARLSEREEELEALLSLAAVQKDNEGSAPAARVRAARLVRAVERFSSQYKEDRRKIATAVASLDADIKRVRMVPFAEGCHGLDRIVRDLASAASKEVGLVIRGGDVELDRAVLDGLRDPLMHLVRNAVDHAIELPEERTASGKSPRGQIIVSASLRGGDILVSVEDDGRGLDLDAVRAQLRRRKLPEPARDDDLARSIFLAGFSTARLITDVSGRGVGLDVVKKRIEAMRGVVDLSFRPGEGTRFSVVVPLTLTTIRGLLVRAGGQTFVLPVTSVKELLRIAPEALRSMGGTETLALRGEAVPIVALAAAVGRPAEPFFTHAYGVDPSMLTSGKAAVVIVSSEGCDVGLVVDELMDERQIVVKSLGPRLRSATHLSGATVLPSGRLALILSTAEVVARARSHKGTSLRASADTGKTAKKYKVLLVDDSITTRALERSILEAGGYSVVVAFDGAEGWRLLQEQAIDVVVSDVEMPRMDGFALTESIRNTPRFRDLPVVLVTGRASPADRARGLEVGANAYLVKSDFDQQHLLETLAQLL